MRLPGWFAETIEPTSPRQRLPVSTLELFFDLVFVFTITQLTTLLVDGLGGDAEPQAHPAHLAVGVLRALLIFGVIWWMYSGYAWLTNTVPPTRPARRVLILLGMAGFLIMALAIPTAFDGGGWAFALGYLVIVVVHAGLFLQATASIVRVVPFNLAGTALLFLAASLHGPVVYVVWAATVALLWGSPYFIGQKGFRLHPAHMVERHGLLVIVALGESVVAIGIGAHGEVGPPLLLAATLGLALAACLWWSYFGADEDEAAEHTLRHATEENRIRLILGAYFYAHMPMLLGIVMVAAGVKTAIGHPLGPAGLGAAMALSLGLVAAVAALATILLGLWSAFAQLASLVALLVAALAFERHPAARQAVR